MTSEARDIAVGLTKAQARNLLALPKSDGVWLTVSEMRGDGATGSGMDLLWCYHLKTPLCVRRWAKWGDEPGQKRGVGYEYTATPLGLAVRAELERQEQPK